MVRVDHCSWSRVTYVQDYFEWCLLTMTEGLQSGKFVGLRCEPVARAWIRADQFCDYLSEQISSFVPDFRSRPCGLYHPVATLSALSSFVQVCPTGAKVALRVGADQIASRESGGNLPGRSSFFRARVGPY